MKKMLHKNAKAIFYRPYDKQIVFGTSSVGALGVLLLSGAR